MSKKFIVQVHANTEYAHEFAPEFALIEIDSALAFRIQRLQRSVKTMECYCAEDFNSQPEWKMVEEFPEDGPPAEDELHPWEGTAEIVTLRVTDKEFQWTGSVKHSSINFETEPIDIKELEELS